jgi:pSer/pThr/pTyr-binding forkhead associated (FHA) protein
VPFVNVRAALIPLDGSSTVEVVKDMTLVGRKEDCDLRLNHKSISKIHCVIVKTDGLLLLRDLGSTNGTRVNGTRVRRAALLPNDKVSFANFHFKVHLGPADAAVVSNEQTQAIAVDDAVQAGPPALVDSSLEQPIIQVQVNALPDVYPDEEKRK